MGCNAQSPLDRTPPMPGDRESPDAADEDDSADGRCDKYVDKLLNVLDVVDLFT